MTKLVPLLDTSDNARTRALLRAGRGDTPPSHFSRRLLVGAGLAGAATSLTATAAANAAGSAVPGAAGGSGVTGIVLVATKWVAVGVLGGGILAAGASTAFTLGAKAPQASVSAKRAGGAPSASRPSPAVGQVAVEPAAPAVVVSAVPVEAKPPRATPLAAVSSSASSKTQDGQLGYEVRLIDRARQALAEGDVSRAALELDTFERGAKTGVLDREARVLRIDVLTKLGQNERARSLALQYLQAYPSDAHAARLRALVAEGKPQ